MNEESEIGKYTSSHLIY